MNQVTHIFRKDLRHHWPEIAASACLLAIYGWHVARSWRGTGYGAVGIGGAGILFASEFLAGFTGVLLPLAWAFLVVRVIQSESLVGDRQFWVTRPYEWPQLLTAKILVILVALDIPWLVAQCALLGAAHFSPAGHLGGLLGMQAAMWVAMFLPLLALAVMTATVVQTALGVVAIILALFGISAIASNIPNASFSFGLPSALEGLLYIAAAIAIVLIQYSRRKRRTAFIVAVALVCVVALIEVVSPYRTLIGRRFPQLASGEKPPVQFMLTELKQEGQFHSREQVLIELPFRPSGLDPDTVITVDGDSAQITNSAVKHDFHWHGAGGVVLPETQAQTFMFALKRSEYERLQSEPVSLDIAVAMSEFRVHDRRQMTVPAGQFEFQGVGRCVADRELRCLAPLRGPAFLLVRMHSAESTCPLSEGQQRPAPDVVAWGEVRFGNNPAFGISPVQEVAIYTSQSSAPRTPYYGICPGTPVEFSNPQLERRFQVHLHYDRIQLRDYVLRNATGQE